MESKEQAFNALYDQYSDDIFRYLFYRLRNRDKALDLTQDVFSKFWTYISEGNEVEHPRAFLYRSAHNAFVNNIRDKKLDLSLEWLQENGIEFAYTEQDKADIERQSEVVERLKSIDERYREVLILRYINGLKVKEIAELRGESENNVSVRIHRGLQKLKKTYE